MQRGLGSRMECEASRKRISGIATGYLESQWFPVKEMMYTGFILSIFKWRHETFPAWPQPDVISCEKPWVSCGFLHHGLDSPQPTLTFRVFNPKTIGPSMAKWLREPTNSKPERCDSAQFGHLFFNQWIVLRGNWNLWALSWGNPWFTVNLLVNQHR